MAYDDDLDFEEDEEDTRPQKRIYNYDDDDYEYGDDESDDDFYEMD